MAHGPSVLTPSGNEVPEAVPLPTRCIAPLPGQPVLYYIMDIGPWQVRDLQGVVRLRGCAGLQRLGSFLRSEEPEVSLNPPVPGAVFPQSSRAQGLSARAH